MNRLVLSLISILLCLAPHTWAREVLQLGQNGQITWKGKVDGIDNISTIKPAYRSILNPNITELGTAPANLVNFSSDEYPDAILPRRILEGENIAADTKERGGNLRAPTVFDLTELQLTNTLEQLLENKSTGQAFERKGRDVLGTLLILDLGARIGVNQIRFFPRNTVFPSPTTPFQEDFLKNYDVQLNDGLVLTAAGNPIWENFTERTNNTDPIATIDIDPPRFLRFIRLRASSGIPFEVEKIQVFGEGFLPTVRYISPIIDMSVPANWGRLRWSEDLVGNKDKVNIQIRSRSGNDPTPFEYTRRRVGLQDAAEIPFSLDDSDAPLLRKEYNRLPVKGGSSDVWERGPVKEDLTNWSPWTSPYNGAEGTDGNGTLILSPGPRRYIQLRVDFQSEDIGSTIVLKQLAFDFTTPPLADELIGEIFPRQVEAATTIPFVYAVKAHMESNDLQGFDAFELITGSRINRIERIEIINAAGESIIDHTFAVQTGPTEEGQVAITTVTDRGFSVRFPLIQEHDSVLKIHFTNRILSFSTLFEGRAFLLAEDAFQGIIPGDAATLGNEDVPYLSGATVLSASVNDGSLIGNFEVAKVITPNGDGINDQAALEYEILAVVGGARITVDIFDLDGHQLFRLFDQIGNNGAYNPTNFAELTWDARDDQGNIVPPGLYLVQLRVDGDARESTSIRTLAVAY